MNRPLRFLPPQTLRPHEETIDERLAVVIDLILCAQTWTRPICVEAASLCIMDGHHRHLAALHLGLAVVPIVTFDYGEVLLGSWTPGLRHDAAELVERAGAGALLPPKSTRHVFPPFDAPAVPLDRLVGPDRWPVTTGAGREG